MSNVNDAVRIAQDLLGLEPEKVQLVFDVYSAFRSKGNGAAQAVAKNGKSPKGKGNKAGFDRSAAMKKAWAKRKAAKAKEAAAAVVVAPVATAPPAPTV